MDGTLTGTQVDTTHLQALDLQVSGMTCSGCAGRVEKALSAVEGVQSATVNLATEKAHIEALSGQTLSSDILISAVTEAGYQASYVDDYAPVEPQVNRREAILLGLSVLLTLPFLAQMILMPTPLHFEWPAIVQLVLATIVQFVPGSRFYGPAWRALKARAGNMDMLVVLGTTATWGLSCYLIWSHGLGIDAHALYFEASATVITLILVGKYLESRARHNTASAIKSLMALRPDTARVRREGKDIEVPLASVRVGDLLVIKPGERIPADGHVTEGMGHADESLITGESLPVAKEPGSLVIGGAINGEGLLIVKTTAVGADSKLAHIIKLVETAQVSKAPVQKLVDRIASYFVPFIIVVAVLTFAGWLVAGASVENALIYAATVLVIACPCALGLATPTAIIVGTGVAAKSGILIRDMEALEHARLIDCVVFDKTGTLTEGKPRVVHVVASQKTKEELIRQVAAAQQGSEHPLAKAMLVYAEAQGLELPTVKKFQSLPGRGLSAEIEGETLWIGSRRLMQEKDIVTAPLETEAKTFEESGNTLVWVGNEKTKQVSGLVAIGDTLRQTAAPAIARIKQLGMEAVLLSGDNSFAANKVAADLGISRVFADVLPEDKANKIEELKADGYHVAMVGDGVNDAPALATADIGIAMGSGTDVAMETAGITLMRTNPALVIDAIDISAATYAKIRQNLFWAFVYNVVAIPLAVSGALSPVIAGAAMAMSSVSVVSNSLLLKRWRGREQKI